jgi:hypothetical protein
MIYSPSFRLICAMPSRGGLGEEPNFAFGFVDFDVIRL